MSLKKQLIYFMEFLRKEKDYLKKETNNDHPNGK